MLTIGTAGAEEKIRQSADGLDVLVPNSIFRQYVSDLQELDVLRAYKARMDIEIIPQLKNQILSLEVAREQERRAAQATIMATERKASYAEQKSKTPGLGIGIGYGSGGEWVGTVGLVWKISNIIPWM